MLQLTALTSGLFPMCKQCGSIITLRPRQNGRHFADGIFKCIVFNANFWISSKNSLKYVHTALLFFIMNPLSLTHPYSKRKKGVISINSYNNFPTYQLSLCVDYWSILVLYVFDCMIPCWTSSGVWQPTHQMPLSSQTSAWQLAQWASPLSLVKLPAASQPMPVRSWYYILAATHGSF